MKKIINFKKILQLSILFMPFSVLAVTITNPLGTEDVQSMMLNILNAVMGIVGFIAVAMIIYGGLQYMVSGGESEKTEKAKKTITMAVIGLIVAILSVAIVNFIIRAISG